MIHNHQDPIEVASCHALSLVVVIGASTDRHLALKLKPMTHLPTHMNDYIGKKITQSGLTVEGEFGASSTKHSRHWPQRFFWRAGRIFLGISSFSIGQLSEWLAGANIPQPFSAFIDAAIPSLPSDTFQESRCSGLTNIGRHDWRICHITATFHRA